MAIQVFTCSGTSRSCIGHLCFTEGNGEFQVLLFLLSESLQPLTFCTLAFTFSPFQLLSLVSKLQRERLRECEREGWDLQYCAKVQCSLSFLYILQRKWKTDLLKCVKIHGNTVYKSKTVCTVLTSLKVNIWYEHLYSSIQSELS